MIDQNKVTHNGNIHLIGNNLFKELRFKLIYLFPIYCIIQIFHELKYGISYVLTFFLTGKLRKISKSLFHEGFYHYKNFYSESTVENLKKELINENSDLFKDLSVEIEGSKKFALNEHDQSIYKLFNVQLLKFLNFIITSKYIKIPAVKYAITRKVNIQKQRFFASHAHFDSYLHEMKVLVALDNINENHGPTLFLPRSGNYSLKYFKQYFVSWLEKLNYIKLNQSNMIPLSELDKKNVIKFCPKPGDIIIFDSRFLHRAIPISDGERRVIWLNY
jgi:hypothetical protein